MDDWLANTVSVAAVDDVEGAYQVTISTIECFTPVPLIEFGFGEENDDDADVRKIPYYVYCLHVPYSLL